MRHPCLPLLLALALPLACGRGEEAGRDADREAAPRASPAAGADARAPLPERGAFEVSFGASGIVARANQAPRRRVLEAVARETDLVVLVFVEGGDPDGLVTLDSAGEPIEVVLARALAGVPFSIEPLDTEGRARLTVVVGRGAGAAGRGPIAARPAPPRRPLEPGRAAESLERANRLEEDALAQLESPDPRERAEGVEWADVGSVMGYEAVLDRLANDPDPDVRAAAADSLGSADVGAVRPLLAALGDSEPRVVLAALESLEMLGDASILPDLESVLEHPDASVRERAREVAEFLE